MEKVDQVLKNGHIIQDYDQKLSTTELFDVFASLFGDKIKKCNKQIIAYNKIGLLVTNVTYLGNPHPKYKKRIQLKKYYLDYYFENESNGIKTIYVGVYTYKETQLFVVFEPETYVDKESHNSSAHIYSLNLQYAQRNGEFHKEDAFKNHIHIFKKEHFIKYVKKLAEIDEEKYDYPSVMNVIHEYMEDFFKKIPLEWNGIEAYKQMKSDITFKNYRQNRWPGFYFEYLFQKYLKENETVLVKWNSDKRKNGIDFDIAFPSLPWVYGDMKADQFDEDVIGNSFDTFNKVILENNGTVYYICALCKSESDSDHGYEVTKHWNSLRDENKRYKSMEEIRSGFGKQMKYSVKIISINILKIDKTMYKILKETPFNQGKNSNGKTRDPKLKVNKDLISALTIYQMKY